MQSLRSSRLTTIGAPVAMSALAAVALAGCGTKTLSASYLDGKVSSLLQSKFNTTFTTTCPTSLDYKVGAHETCTVVATGKTAKNYVLLTIDSTDNGGHFTIKSTTAPNSTP